MAANFQQRNQPVISVDTKKKELVGDFKNAGQEWQPKESPEKVQVHDFPDDAIGKAIPYGVYDMARNEAWVSIGQDHDTPAFAVASIRQWWRTMGQQSYPHATELLITADAGGSNGYRSRAWKLELQRFADETGLHICVCHFPPGTSKWNKIEDRTPPLLPYHPKLARPPACQLRHGSESHWQHAYSSGTSCESEARPQALSNRGQDFQGRNQGAGAEKVQVSWRVELRAISTEVGQLIYARVLRSTRPPAIHRPSHCPVSCRSDWM